MFNYLNFSSAFIFDPLSLFFVGVILLISLPSFIYSLGYLKGHYSPAKIWFGHLLFWCFILSMLATVTVGNVFTFLVAWELMSLFSYLLVMFDGTNPKTIQAGIVYIVMTQMGTALLLAAFFLMFKYSGSFDFIAIKTALVSLPSLQKNLIFLLLLAGFGTKAGIVPLHIWLPQAHPQAPSHISALMSGVMLKTALYGLIRFVIILLGINAVWWGILIIALALISCLVGVIYALMEHDIKTLLAYHSVENIGIILLGMGASMLFIKMDLAALAALAMCACLYHLINHAVFKGLLFLCAGSIYNATGTRNIDKLGGLINKMPWTSAFFLAGAMAISALPPLNGFVSEWLTFIALFLGALALAGNFKIFLCVSAALLALTGGLAAACFVKAFGITFLARSRSVKAETAQESGILMQTGMGFLTIITVVLGLGAAFFIPLFINISKSIFNLDALPTPFSLDIFSIAPTPVKNIYLSTPLITLLLFSIAAFSFFILNLIWGKPKITIGPTWDCGYYQLTARDEYTATGFSKPFRLAFSFFLLPYKKLKKIKESHYHIKSLQYETHTTKIFREYLYGGFLGGIFNAARYMRRIQTGSIHLYLGYIFIVLFILIFWIGRF